ncbi:MAG: HAMP domain-containing sensor histidine kinase [Actinomycetota bacterium]
MTINGARSVRSKLAAVLIGVALLSVLLVSLVGVRLVRQAADQASLDELQRQANRIASESSFLRKDPNQAVRFLRNALDLSGAALYEIRSDGSLLLLGGSTDVPLDGADIAALVQGKTVQGTRHVGKTELVFVAQPLLTLRARQATVVVIGREAGVTLPIGRRLLAAGVVAVCVAILVSAYVAQKIAQPMTDLAKAARDVALGDFTARVEVNSDDEIGVVGSSFNHMATELGSANERQREFFLSISHELRTPLTAIQGYAEAIEDGTAGTKGRHAAGIIVTESKRLTRLVSDLLDLARIDARRFNVALQAVEITEVLEQIRRTFAAKASETDVEIKIESSGGTVNADHDRLVQVLSNLVENGLRYTPANGSIVLASRAKGTAFEISVIDGGSGLELSDLHRAFERQYLWTKYKGLREVGTGLGLAISKELVEAMNGTVSVTNEPGAGARFNVELPAAAYASTYP